MYGREESISEKTRAQYKKDVDVLVKYIPWFDKIQGKSVQSIYDGEKDFKVIQIPVYDSNLLSFVKEADKTALITKNYPYVYTRLRIKTAEDELKAVNSAHLKDIETLKGILSKYILMGKSKASVWREGVENGVLSAIVKRLKYLFYNTNVE
ncbi:MAG: hypothetical protein K5886_03010 [Lachnospiraceae bacterium]|nr:hypothetical protein [Lachnospiraceae bacterium]